MSKSILKTTALLLGFATLKCKSLEHNNMATQQDLRRCLEPEKGLYLYNDQGTPTYVTIMSKEHYDEEVDPVMLRCLKTIGDPAGFWFTAMRPNDSRLKVSMRITELSPDIPLSSNSADSQSPADWPQQTVPNDFESKTKICDSVGIYSDNSCMHSISSSNTKTNVCRNPPWSTSNFRGFLGLAYCNDYYVKRYAHHDCRYYSAWSRNNYEAPLVFKVFKDHFRCIGGKGLSYCATPDPSYKCGGRDDLKTL